MGFRDAGLTVTPASSHRRLSSSVRRPVLCGLLLHHGTAPLGVAGPFRATAWLLGPGPELSVVPSRWTSRSLLVGHTTPPSARRVEAVRTGSLLSPLEPEFISAAGADVFCP